MESKKIKLLSVIQIVLVVVCIVWIVSGGSSSIGGSVENEVRILNK